MEDLKLQKMSWVCMFVLDGNCLIILLMEANWITLIIKNKFKKVYLPIIIFDS